MSFLFVFRVFTQCQLGVAFQDDFMNVDEIETQVIEIHIDLSNVHGVINVSTIATTCDFMNLTPKEYENELMMVFNLSLIHIFKILGKNVWVKRAKA